MVFAIMLIGTGVYGFMQGESGSNIDTTIKPVVQIQKIDEWTLSIVVNHNQPIRYITYNWNSETDQRINGNNKKNIQETIEIIPGNNILNVLVEDMTGNKATYSNEFSYVTGGDMEKPKIVMQVSGNYVNITATDETEMAYITYNWNSEEAIRVEAEREGATSITASVEVKKGENILNVVAVDKNENKETEQRTYKGVTRPTIDVVQDGNTLVITVEDVEGIKYVDIDLNLQRLRLQSEQTENRIVYNLSMENGGNVLKVVAYSVNGEKTEFQGQATTF